MDVSIIIVNYNTKNLCENCIRSVFEKTKGIEYEIILVDNHSQDESAEYLQDLFRDKIQIIANEENIGFGRANNLGIEYSSGKYVFLLNSDTVLLNNAIKILYDVMEDNHEIGIAGGNLYSAEGAPMHSYRKEFPSLKNDFIPNIFSRVWRKLNYSKSGREFNPGKDNLEVGYVTGADMMIRRAALDKAGLFDREFFMYSEEVELTYRITRCGYRVLSVPAAKIIHLEGASSGAKKGLNVFKEKNLLNGKCLLYEKVYGASAVPQYLKKHRFECLRGVIHDIVLFQYGQVARDIYKYRLAKSYYKSVKAGKVPYREDK